MKVIVNTRTVPENCRYELVSADEAFSHADILTIHCPLTEQTEKLVNSRTLALMKDGALLINTARGGIVDENALAAELERGRLYAALDVLRQEPMSESSPVRDLENCTITPHTAWAPLETRRRLIDIVCANIRAYLDGSPQNKVN